MEVLHKCAALTQDKQDFFDFSAIVDVKGIKYSITKFTITIASQQKFNY